METSSVGHGTLTCLLFCLELWSSSPTSKPSEKVCHTQLADWKCSEAQRRETMFKARQREDNGLGKRDDRWSQLESHTRTDRGFRSPLRILR